MHITTFLLRVSAKGAFLRRPKVFRGGRQTCKELFFSSKNCLWIKERRFVLGRKMLVYINFFYKRLFLWQKEFFAKFYPPEGKKNFSRFLKACLMSRAKRGQRQIFPAWWNCGFVAVSKACHLTDSYHKKEIDKKLCNTRYRCCLLFVNTIYGILKLS